MKNLWTTIKVKNMEESLNFYTEILDLEVDRRFKPNPDMEIAFLGTGETKLEIIYNSHEENINYSGNVSTGLSIDSVDEFIDYLKSKGISVTAGPFQPNEHVKFFYITDPNGYKIQLVEEC